MHKAFRLIWFLCCKYFTMAWITLDHLVCRFEARRRDVGHGQAFVRGLVGAQDRRIRHEREVNSGKINSSVITSPNVYKSCPKWSQQKNERFLYLYLQKLSKNVGDLAKLLLPHTLKNCPKCSKSPNLVTLITSFKFQLWCIKWYLNVEKRSLIIKSWSSLDKGESLACQTTSSFTKR